MGEATTPTKELVDRQLAVRNQLGEASLKLARVFERIPGYERFSISAEYGDAASETGFFPAMLALTSDLEAFAGELRRRVDELDRLF